MSSIDAINQAPDGIKRASAASLLIGQRPNPWFNVLAGVVVVAGIIYTGIHLADDLAVVRDRIDKLPETERAEWQKFWEDVNDLLKRTASK